MDFKNKIIIITGASSGIGYQTSLDLASKGSIIVMLARDKKKLEQTFQEVSKLSPKSSYFTCDVSSQSQVNSVVKKIKEKYKRIDVLINNAGIGIYRPFLEQSLQEIESQMNVNYYGIVHLCKAVAPIMKAQSSGHIINVASVAGKSGYAWAGPYSASKFAVVGLSEALYCELDDHGIDVSVICPGAVNTPFFDHPSFQKFPHEIRHKNMLKPSQVSNKIIKALKTKRFEFILPFRSKIILMSKQILRQTYMKVLRRLERE